MVEAVNNGFATDSVLFEPSGEMSAAMVGQMRDLFAVAVNRTEDAGEDLEWQLEIHFRLNPKTARAGIGQGERAEMFGGNSQRRRVRLHRLSLGQVCNSRKWLLSQSYVNIPKSVIIAS